MLALLVVLALILITASFGGSGGGALRTVQSGFLDVLSPVETVASKALTPVHDLINAVDNVVHASSQRNQLRKELAQKNRELAALESSRHARSDSAKLHRLDTRLRPQGIGQRDGDKLPSGVWVSNVTIVRRCGAGIRVDDPVIDPDGVIGTVTTVAAGAAVVTLIDDPTAASRRATARAARSGSSAPSPAARVSCR